MDKSLKSSQRILVIDDDPSLLKLTGRLLETKGYHITLANEAPLGLELAMKEPPDLIILDVMMPIINGYNICRLLKSEDTHRHIPIIFLTSRTEEDDRRIGTEVGADAYIAKPFDSKDLFEKVEDLLNHQNN